MGVSFLVALGSTLGRSFRGYLWSSWAPFRILGVAFLIGSSLGPLSLVPPLPFLGCFLGDLSAFYILHYMIHYERPIGFTAYRFLALAAAVGKCPHFVGDMRHEQCANSKPFCFTTVYIQPL